MTELQAKLSFPSLFLSLSLTHSPSPTPRHRITFFSVLWKNEQRRSPTGNVHIRKPIKPPKKKRKKISPGQHHIHRDNLFGLGNTRITSHHVFQGNCGVPRLSFFFFSPLIHLLLFLSSQENNIPHLLHLTIVQFAFFLKKKTSFV